MTKTIQEVIDYLQTYMRQHPLQPMGGIEDQIDKLKTLLPKEDLMCCVACHQMVDSTTTRTCMTSHVELEDYDIAKPENYNECPDDYFYCEDCINNYGMCKNCDSMIDESKQKQIWER